ncbi:MAG: hypothetical protein QE487_16130 [Fluviicola sp.]|nr:hypothetical protein [Fluviicola sp.]
MKNAILLTFLFFSGWAAAQVSDTTVARAFWNDNIQTIVKANVTKVLTQTHYPLEVKTGQKREKLTKEQFKTRYKSIFTSTIVAELASEDIDAIDAFTMGDDETETYMLACMLSEESDAAIVLCFKQFNGKWQLYLVDYHLE